MKKIVLLFAAVFIIASCSKKEEKFELFSAEAFAYSLDESWELNASCRVKGFIQNENNDKFSAKLSYTADLLTPDGKLLGGIDEGLIDKSSDEKIIDLEIEIQVQLDNFYLPGKYKIIINVTDDLSQKTLKIEKEFELSK